MQDLEIENIKQGTRIREARELTMLSRSAFAKKYDFNLSSLQAWEAGRNRKGIKLRDASELVAALLAENIDCTLDWLLEGRGEPPTRHSNLLHATRTHNHQELIKQAEKFKLIREKNNELIIAIKHNKIVTARELISQGANLHHLRRKELYLYSQKEDTPLHTAASFAGATLTKLFMELGINPNIRNRYNDTALHMAAYVNNIPAIKVLIEANANIEASNTEGTTPLMWAALNGRKQACEILIENSAKINNTDFSGNTALHWAAFGGQRQIIELLYKKGALVNVKNHDGQLAFDVALKNGRRKAVETLIELKAF